MYLSESLSNQTKSAQLKNEFSKMYDLLKNNESKIIEEINKHQGKSANLCGYYATDIEKTEKIMRPSSTLNNIINTH